MDRRTLLKNTVALGSIATLGGCLSDGTGDGGTTESNGTDAPTTTPPMAVSDRSIETTSTTCGDENTASVTFEDAGATISGSIPASTPCHDATLVDVSASGDELQVTVGTTERDTDSCESCLGAISYTAEVTTNNGPQSTTVTHEHMGETTTVAEESR